MKKATFLFVLTALLISSVSFAQSPATSYRSGYDWITRGYDLSNAYGGKITFKGAYLNGYPMGGDLILQGGYG
ncbi:MAG: hypothetical protein JW894_06930, partial [Bacteroidales bacterium]|nr:hypothetical protein [Bacteroidales bacterium]